jgi:hypothetical protein
VFYPVSLRREGFCLPSTFDGFFRGTRCCNHALDLVGRGPRRLASTVVNPP